MNLGHIQIVEFQIICLENKNNKNKSQLIVYYGGLLSLQKKVNQHEYP